MLPNLLWMLFPSRGQPEGGAGPTSGLHRLMEILEWVGRIAALVVPFFYRIEAQSPRQVIALVVAAMALLFYYAGWARYFLRDRRYALLFDRFLGVPIPLAISPIVCFLATSVLFGSWTLALASVILGVGHLWITVQESQHSRAQKEST
jgi:hypothetical protein